MHANLCVHILASTCQDGGNPFPVIRPPVVNSVTDSSRHTLLLPALHSQWSRQVYIIHQSITGFLVVQEPTCTHAHEYRLLGASFFFFFLVSHLCMQIYASPPIFIIIPRRNYKEEQFFSKFLAGVELAISEAAVQCLIHWATAGSVNLLLEKLVFNCQARSQVPRIFSRWQPLFRASSKCLRPVSIMLARATPQSPAMKRPLENLEPCNYHIGKPKTFTTRKQAESWSVFDRCMSSSDKILENVLKSCAMRARAERMVRTSWQTLQKKRLQHETPPD